MANLGFVGLGVMGGADGEPAARKGPHRHRLQPHRSKAQWLIDKGMKWADSPRAVAAAADVTFAMVTNSAALDIDHEGRTGYWRA